MTYFDVQRQHQHPERTEVGQKLNHQTKKWDYVKEAMEAKGEKDADDMKHEKPLADAMVREGYLMKKGMNMAQRAVDHTSLHYAPRMSYTERSVQKAANVAKGQANLMKEVSQAISRKNVEDSATEAPLAREMVKQGYLKPHNVISNPLKPVVASQAHPTKLTPRAKTAPESNKEEAERLLKILSRSTWHDTSQARSDLVKPIHGKQTKLLNLAMKAEEGKRAEDRKTAKTMLRDIRAENESEARTSLAMKSHIPASRSLIDKAIKEQDQERANGEAEMRLDKAALANTDSVKPHAGHVAKKSNSLFEQAVKEAQADRAKSRVEREADLKMSKILQATEGQSLIQKSRSNKGLSLIQQAIHEKDEELQKGMREEEKDDRSTFIGIYF